MFNEQIQNHWYIYKNSAYTSYKPTHPLNHSPQFFHVQTLIAIPVTTIPVHTILLILVSSTTITLCTHKRRSGLIPRARSHLLMRPLSLYILLCCPHSFWPLVFIQTLSLHRCWLLSAAALAPAFFSSARALLVSELQLNYIVGISMLKMAT